MSFENTPDQLFQSNTGNPKQIADHSKILGFWLIQSPTYPVASKSAYHMLNVIRGIFPSILSEECPVFYGTFTWPLFEYANQIAHTGLIKNRK